MIGYICYGANTLEKFSDFIFMSHIYSNPGPTVPFSLVDVDVSRTENVQLHVFR